MIRIDFLAEHGETIWLEYGDARAPHRILIDSGHASCFEALASRLEWLPSEDRHFDLLVVTAPDAAGRDGVAELLARRDLGVSVGEIWFNSATREAVDAPADEDFFDAAEFDGEGDLDTQLARAPERWNTSLGRGPVCSHREGWPRALLLPGGLELLVLGPAAPGEAIDDWTDTAATESANIEPARRRATAATRERRFDAPRASDVQHPRFSGASALAAQHDAHEWTSSSRAANDANAGWTEDDDVRDLPALAVGADLQAERGAREVALLLRHEGHQILLAADMGPRALLACLDRLVAGDQRLALDLCVLPSADRVAGMTRELLDRLSCRRFVAPAAIEAADEVTLARVVLHGGHRPQLFFRDRGARAMAWNDPVLLAAHDYSAHYPDPDGEGLCFAW